MLMFLGFIPGLVDVTAADTRKEKLFNFLHTGQWSSYSFLLLLWPSFFLFLLLFYKIKLPVPVYLWDLFLYLLALLVNQVRGHYCPLLSSSYLFLIKLKLMKIY